VGDSKSFAHDPTLSARAREITLTLVGWPSVTGTPEEAAFAGRLAGLLREIPYLRANPEHLLVEPVPGDALGRSNVLALVRGAGPRTVLLSGHFDVVPTDDYGALAPLAGDPQGLVAPMVARLRESGANPLALADLESGAFLPGRGVLDMKSGLAAGIAVLERFAAEEKREGNLLLVATPDEEDRSAGMRAAAEALPGFLRAHGLEPVLGINLDATCDNGDGRSGQTVALGCIGKLLLSALVVGKEAHACYPLDGVNAAYLAAELVTELEFLPELGEESGTEIASPPTVLGSRDLKAVYNVTTPGRVWTSWNVLMRSRPAAEILAIAGDAAERAVLRAAARLRERAARLENRAPLTPAWDRIRVLRFEEVFARAQEASPDFGKAFDALAQRLAGRPELDLPTRCRDLTELAWEASGLQPPAIVLGFASLPYPPVRLPKDAEALERHLRGAAAAIAAACETPITVIDQMPVIVDMSFLGPVEAEDLRTAARSTPIWGSSIRWDLDVPTPAMPMVNIGPWGRDYHHWLERANARYTFEVLPALAAEMARRVLSAG